MTHPFGGETVDLRIAVEFIAAALYPDENKRSSCDRVRQAFRYHQKKGNLPPGDTFETRAILLWLHQQWPVLGTAVPNLPRPLKGNVSIRPALMGRIRIASVPADLEQLRQFATDTEFERQRLASENDSLRAKLAEAELRIAELTLRRKAQHARAVEAGKQGGRGKFK